MCLRLPALGIELPDFYVRNLQKFSRKLYVIVNLHTDRCKQIKGHTVHNKMNALIYNGSIQVDLVGIFSSQYLIVYIKT